MNNKIIEEIDKFKLMCMLDMATPEKTDLEKYEEFVDKMMGRHVSCHHYPFETCILCDPSEYANYRSLKCLVEDLFYRKHGDKREYQKHRDEIRKITAEIIAMTLFVQKEIK
jgi:hypothetical protein